MDICFHKKHSEESRETLDLLGLGNVSLLTGILTKITTLSFCLTVGLFV